ncbi:MAG TPA: alpha/beta hydrolase [Nocardioidaceae bacterium]|nr:alpha/beta hydrolase [Nocardioidaceae bacterium]
MATTAANAQQEELAFIKVNGVLIAYAETAGTGIPLVLVHGSWGSHHNWDPVVPGLAEHFRVVSYDRRGHSESERPPGQGHFSEDVADLAALIEQLGHAPAWVIGNSSGAVITLQLAASRPDLLRGIVVHEPPLFGILDEGSAEALALAEVETGPLAEVGRRIAAGDHAGAAEQFVEQVALGPGSWSVLPDAMRATMTGNALTYLDELNDPECSSVDETRLTAYDGPVLITSGEQSPSIFQPVERRIASLLPQAKRTTYAGAGHIPHVTHPEEYIAGVVGFIESNEVRR